MKHTLSQQRLLTAFLAVLFCLTTTLTVYGQPVSAQTKLSLADILVGLRSKKATVEQRNKLLVAGVKGRGISFSLNPEIEKELRATGASSELIEAIREQTPKTLAPDIAALQRADELFDKARYADAAKQYDEVIKLNPQNAQAFLRRGYSYHYLGDTRRALESYNQAIRVNPALAAEPYVKCVLYNGAKDDAEAMIGICFEGLRMNPNFSLLYYKRAGALFARKEYDLALLDYDKAIKLNPEFIAAYNNRGNTYAAKGDAQSALSEYNKAFSINAEYIDTYLNRGITYAELKDYDRALSDFNKIIELEPDNADAYINRGNVFDEKGDFEKALADFNKAVSLAPRNARAYYNRGVAFFNKDKLDDAIFDFNKAILIDGAYADAFYNRGVAYDKKRNYNQAVADLEKSLTLNPLNADAFYKLGNAYLNLENYDRAIANFSKAVERKPDFAAVYLARGSVYEFKKDFEKAGADYQKVVEINPENKEAQESLKRVQKKKK